MSYEKQGRQPIKRLCATYVIFISFNTIIILYLISNIHEQRPGSSQIMPFKVIDLRCDQKSSTYK